MGGEYWRWTREHSYVEGENSFARGNDFRMGTARAYAEHYFKMVLAMTNQESRVKAQICWKSVGGMTDPAG